MREALGDELEMRDDRRLRWGHVIRDHRERRGDTRDVGQLLVVAEGLPRVVRARPDNEQAIALVDNLGTDRHHRVALGAASRSAASRADGSPVVASATIPWAPASSTRLPSAASALRSTPPDSSNGVTSGTKTPAGRSGLPISEMYAEPALGRAATA